MYISECHDSNNILFDVQNIEHLETNKERILKPYLIKYSSLDYDYKIKKMYEDLSKVNFKESGDSIYYINSSGCHINISECKLLKGSNYNFENIPKLFYTNRVISVIKNKDQKCFIYNYIRKFLNNVNKHQDRVSLKDKEIANKLEEELNFNFDNVKIKDLSKIENLLETNIYVYTLIFDGILLLPGQQINIADIQSYLFDKTNIPMKISIKPFKDFSQNLENQI